MPVVKFRDKNEWWSAPTIGDIEALSAKISIDTGALVIYDLCDLEAVPEGYAWVGELGNVSQYTEAEEPVTVDDADRNTEYQRKYRAKMADEGMRLLRVYVPEEDYDECYKFCKEMCE